MARVNVDDHIWTDPRFVQMSISMGSQAKAIGVLVALWRQGQEYWKQDRSLIPATVFSMIECFSELLKFGFVSDHGNAGFYCSGSEERWNYLFAMSEGGKRSAEARKKKYGSAIPPNANNAPPSPGGSGLGGAPSNACAEGKFEKNAERTEPSSSSSPLPLLNNKELCIKEVGTEPEFEGFEPPAERSPTVIPFSSYPPPFSDPVITEFLMRAKIKRESAVLWLKTYEDAEWLKLEFLKMVAWLDANRHKRPRSNYARFIGSWLGRGWEWHRKNLQSRDKPHKTWQEIAAEKEKELNGRESL